MPKFPAIALPAALAASLFAEATPIWAEIPEEQRIIFLQGGVELQDEVTGVSFTLKDVQDGRCPSNVLCVWEGSVRLVVEAKLNGKTETLVICNSCKDGTYVVEYYGYSLWTAGLKPRLTRAEQLTVKTELGDYHAGIGIMKGRPDWWQPAE